MICNPLIKPSDRSCNAIYIYIYIYYTPRAQDPEEVPEGPHLGAERRAKAKNKSINKYKQINIYIYIYTYNDANNIVIVVLGMFW